MKLISITLILFYLINCGSEELKETPLQSHEEPVTDKVKIEKDNPISPKDSSEDSDIVTLKNGEIIEAKMAVFTSDSLMVIDTKNKQTFFKKKEVNNVKISKKHESKCVAGNCVNGRGTLVYGDETEHVGNFVSSLKNGKAIVTYADGSVYEGEFKDNLKNGKAIVTHADGSRYIGEYKNNLKTGIETYMMANGDKYIGQYQDEKMNGHGTYFFANGEKYIGQYKDGYYNGPGTFTFANGDKYVGQYRDGTMNGQGIATFANGDKCIGQWEDGNFNGQGTWTNANGSKYIGQWKDGKMNGQGTFTFANGDKYTGQWENGKMNGQGTATFANGDKYTGQWEDGKSNGRGASLKIADAVKIENNLVKGWSAYQGKMNWDKATLKCASLKMRLPTRNELSEACKDGTFEKWNKEEIHEHSLYWASEKRIETSAWSYGEHFLAHAYDVEHDDANITTNIFKETALHVRCIR